MRIQEKTLRIRNVLNELYPVVEPPLDHNSPFQLLVAVVLSASTTDLMVNRVTPALFEAAPTPERMMNLSVAELQQFIATLGLSQAKAGYLKGLSTQLVELHNGEVPNTREALVALPGVGRKTANVVLSQVFDIPAFAVDTHIKRLAYRWGLTRSKNVNIIERDLCRLSFQKSRGTVCTFN